MERKPSPDRHLELFYTAITQNAQQYVTDKITQRLGMIRLKSEHSHCDVSK